MPHPKGTKTFFQLSLFPRGGSGCGGFLQAFKDLPKPKRAEEYLSQHSRKGASLAKPISPLNGSKLPLQKGTAIF